jgi:hypothetical protein
MNDFCDKDSNTSIIISHAEIYYFQNCMNDVFASLNKWFKDSKLTSNFDKTNFLKLYTNNKTRIYLNIWYDDRTI